MYPTHVVKIGSMKTPWGNVVVLMAEAHPRARTAYIHVGVRRNDWIEAGMTGSEPGMTGSGASGSLLALLKQAF